MIKKSFVCCLEFLSLKLHNSHSLDGFTIKFFFVFMHKKKLSIIFFLENTVILCTFQMVGI